jgi:hypothetical protein
MNKSSRSTSLGKWTTRMLFVVLALMFGATQCAFAFPPVEEPIEDPFLDPPEPSPANVIMLVINDSLYPSIQTNVNIFRLDLTGEGYTVELRRWLGGTPDSLRSTLITRYNRPEDNLVGVIFIGNLPIFVMDVPNGCTNGVCLGPGTCDYYYTDMNGTYTDTDADGICDTFADPTGPEIFYGRLTASNLGTITTKPEAELINQYFKKNHYYRLHGFSQQRGIEHRAMRYSINMFSSFMLAPAAIRGMNVAYPDQTFPPGNTDSIYRVVLQDGYEFVSLYSHGGAAGKRLLFDSKPKGIFYHLFGCGSGNFLVPDSGSDAQQYLFSGDIPCDTVNGIITCDSIPDSYGLVAIAFSIPGGEVGSYEFFSSLRNGNCVGQAFMAQIDPLITAGNSREAFITLQGDPTLRTNYCNLAYGDADQDGLADDCDNCRTTANLSQADVDNDFLGDACDTNTCIDSDLDGYGDPGYAINTCPTDNCPTTYNPGQEDPDNDGVGTVCDNCTTVSNPNQTDTDNDGIGDACDNCPTVAGAGEDRDADGLGQVCDNCPLTYNPDQEDLNQNGIGDACENLSYVCGDYNGDSSVNDWDYLQFQNYVFGTGMPAPILLLALDVNCDGNVNAADLSVLAAYLSSGGPAPCSEAVCGGTAKRAMITDTRVLITTSYSENSTVITATTTKTLVSLRLVVTGALAPQIQNLVTDQFSLAQKRGEGTVTLSLADFANINRLAPGTYDLVRLDGRVNLIDAGAVSSTFEEYAVGRGISIENQILPTDFALSQNYPNPFNPTTRIDFALPQASEVRIEVFNLLGQKVKTLVDGQMTGGNHSVEWNGTDDAGHAVSSGVYLYRLQAEDYRETKKMMLLK